MEHGLIRIASATPFIKPGDCAYNRQAVLALMREAASNSCELIVLPELCLTGYTCGDLLRQQVLLEDAEAALVWLAEESKALNLLAFIGLPVRVRGRLFNVAAAICRGDILGVVPKTWLPNYAEFNEKRIFTPPYEHDTGQTCLLGGREIPFGTRLLFRHTGKGSFIVAAEICEDVWSPVPPSCYHALAGATVVVNLSASNESAGKAVYRRQLVIQQSARLLGAYAYASAGAGESTTDLVFSGHNLIAENGVLMAESSLFENGLIYADIDTSLLIGERAKSTTFVNGGGNAPLKAAADIYRTISFTLNETACPTVRPVSPSPFIPSDEQERTVRCLDILAMQTEGLVQRLRHTQTTHLVLALSGGLDSTLALLVAVRAFDRLAIDRKGICAVSMPCFGTSRRTQNNARLLAEAAGCTFKEIPIRESVLKHFEDIGHDPKAHDLVYENAQARERTQVAMDLAAKQKGFMLGTGDLSELALGFSTFNGDHMSMYNVNACVPKTLIPYLIRAAAENIRWSGLSGQNKPQKVLDDILAAPISPELLPPDKETGQPLQETENIIGPYVLHDFFLFHMLRYGSSPEKILFLAERAFNERYSREEILKWLKLFYRRFFFGQFKRSCSPDGPKVGSVCLSPRGDWRMPSDACVDAWLERIDRMGS